MDVDAPPPEKKRKAESGHEPKPKKKKGDSTKPKKQRSTLDSFVKPKDMHSAPTESEAQQPSDMPDVAAGCEEGDATKLTEAGRAAMVEEHTLVSRLEHIKLRPDTYVGSTALTEMVVPVATLSDDKKKVSMSRVKITIIPALINLVQELVSNVYDAAWKSAVREGALKVTTVTVHAAHGAFIISNDGDAIPIAPHKNKPELLIPSVCFGEFGSSTNYDDAKREGITGGRNGYGVKLNNVFSRRFSVSVTDPHARADGDDERVRGAVFTQTWEKGMTVVGEPKKSLPRQPPKTGSVTITWEPETGAEPREGAAPIALLGETCDFTPEVQGLILRRIIDMAVGMPSTVKTIKYNGVPVPVRSLKSLMECYSKMEGDDQPGELFSYDMWFSRPRSVCMLISTGETYTFCACRLVCMLRDRRWSLAGWAGTSHGRHDDVVCERVAHMGRRGS